MGGQAPDERAARSPNLLKTRDDHRPVVFVEQSRSSSDQPIDFKLTDDSTCSWVRPDETFGPDKIRPRIEPWLTALCQSEHLSLLLGSGLTLAVHRLAAAKPLPGMGEAEFGAHAQIVDSEATRSARAAGRQRGNIEDQLRVANELLRGLQILSSADEDARSQEAVLRQKLKDVMAAFASSILEGERALIEADPAQRERAFNYLVSFLMSFASRTGTRDRLHIFTTNYDRYIEAGAEAAGMHLLDRFVGSISPIFRSSRLDLDIHYNPPGIRGEPRYLEGVARFTKLHGSVDWIECESDIRRIAVPLGARDVSAYICAGVALKSDASQLMIFPNAAKDRETASYPYVELFRDFAAAACRPNHTLITFGYSFGDEHLNRVIKDMLTIPSTHLVVISYDDPLGRIVKTYDELGRPAQISLLLGDHIGEFQSLVDNYLPKPAIDKATFRMAEILKSRWGAKQPEKATDPEPSAVFGADE